MINILIRYHEGREQLLKRCIESVLKQTYKEIIMWVSFDTHDAFAELCKYPVTPLRVIKKEEEGDAFYNLYCNDLKSCVLNGWFFILDSDDMLADDDVIEKMIPHLDETKYKAVICQMTRRFGLVKPPDTQIENRQIVSGKIGMPCFFIHHSIKHIADFDATSNADFKYIQQVKRVTKTKFVKQVVVYSPQRRFGK